MRTLGILTVTVPLLAMAASFVWCVVLGHDQAFDTLVWPSLIGSAAILGIGMAASMDARHKPKDTPFARGFHDAVFPVVLCGLALFLVGRVAAFLGAGAAVAAVVLAVLSLPVWLASRGRKRGEEAKEAERKKTEVASAPVREPKWFWEKP